MILFLVVVLGFIGVTLLRLLCYKPFMKRFRIFGRKTKSQPTYNFNHVLSVRQLYSEFRKTRTEIRQYINALEDGTSISEEYVPEVKLFVEKLRQKLKDIIKQFEEIFEKFNVPKN